MYAVDEAIHQIAGAAARGSVTLWATVMAVELLRRTIAHHFPHILLRRAGSP
jgi:hypothetical protein